MPTGSEVMQVWQRHSATLFSFTSFAARRMKLCLSEVAAMEQIGSMGTMTPGELGRSLSMPSATITALVDRLEYKRMVARRPNPNDRRGSLIEMTDTAMEKASLDLVPLAQALVAAAEAMTPEKRMVVSEYLGRAIALMDAQRLRAG